MEDLVSRQMVIEAIGEKPMAWEHGEYEEGMIAKWESDLDAIKDLPSAQHDLEEMIVICDNCGHAIHIKMGDTRPSEVARDIATIIENERDMRVIARTKPPSRIERELNGKSPEEQSRILRWLVLDYSKCFTDSYAALIEWLRGGNDEGE